MDAGRTAVRPTPAISRWTPSIRVGYQVDFWYHVPEREGAERSEALSVDIHYDWSELRVRDAVWTEATVINNMPQAARVVILDLPIPPGFAAAADSASQLMESWQIVNHKITARSIVVCLRELAPAKPPRIRYRLKATMPVRITVPPTTIDEYYDPGREGLSEPTEILVASAT